MRGRGGVVVGVKFSKILRRVSHKGRSDRFKTFLRGGLRKKGWGQDFRVGLIPWRTVCINSMHLQIFTYPTVSVNVVRLFWSILTKHMICKFVHGSLGSGLNPQGCLYFQSFWGSELLNRSSVIWPSNLCLRGTR